MVLVCELKFYKLDKKLIFYLDRSDRITCRENPACPAFVALFY